MDKPFLRIVEPPVDYVRRPADRIRPDLYASLRFRSRPIHRTRFERVCDWLGDTFGESPRGFAFFAGLLLPICAALFCVGYFGLRELLAMVLS